MAIAFFNDKLASTRAGEEARFILECSLRGGLPGRQVTEDEVVAAIDYIRKQRPLPLARFKGQCSLRDLAGHGQYVASVAVERENPLSNGQSTDNQRSGCLPGNETENTSASRRYRKFG